MTMPTTVCTRAVLRMPRCWMAKASSIRSVPMKKVQLMDIETTPRSTVNRVQLWIGISAAVAAASSSVTPAAAWSAMYLAMMSAAGVGSIMARM
jgi:hypothetical protein